MKTKLFTLLLALITSVGTVFAQSGKCGNNLVWTLDENGVLTISGTGAMTNYGDNGGLNQAPWYSYRSTITSVTIGYGVTSIGNNAFYYCSSLTSVTIPSSVTSIGSKAFLLCSALTSVTIPNSVTSIGSGAFFSCDGLTSVRISDIAAWCGIAFTDSDSNPMYYASHLYLNDTEIKNLAIPTSVTSIEKYAFYNCTGLTSVTISNSVTSIGEWAFYGCTGLTSIEIPNSITSIEDNTFYNCTSLTSVTIPNSVTSIGEATFCNCTSLTSVDIPNSVTSIGGSAFIRCTGLTSLDIPNSVTSIGGGAFSGCTGLTSITIPNNVTSIGKGAFSNCSNLTSVTWNAKNCSTDGSENYFDIHVESFVCGDSVEVIPASLCSGITNLTSITISANVTSIGSNAFKSCPITSVIWNAKNGPSYNFGEQVESFVFGDSVEVIPASLCSGMNKLTSITIPNNVISIGSGAFRSCSGLTSITIPSNVTSIGDAALHSCSGLTSVIWEAKNCSDFQSENTPFYYHYQYGPTGNSFDIREQITSFTFGDEVEYIPAYLCSGMTKLTSVTIPDRVTNIGESAFAECSTLTKVTLNSNVFVNNNYFTDENIGAIFGNQVESYILGDSITSIGQYAFFNCTGLTSIEIPNSVKRIGDLAFYGCSSLTNVTIPNSVDSIGYQAFYGCSSLTSVTIPSSITGLGAEIFRGCPSLTSVNLNSNYIVSSRELYNVFGDQVKSYMLGDSIISIGDRAFYYCIGLTSVTIPNSVISIADGAFAHCPSLTSMVVENGNTKYDSRDNCNAIIETATNMLIAGCKNTNIPNRITCIRNYAFDGCADLTSIEIPNSVKRIGAMAFYGCSSLTNITIPNSVDSIGYRAFYGCSGLTSILCAANMPPACGENVFKNVDKSIPLYVPTESINAYKSADVWNEFTNILAIGDSIPEISAPADGYVTIVIKIPGGSECSGIAFKGSLDGSNWSGVNTYVGETKVDASTDECIKFTKIEGTQTWYKATYKLGTSGLIGKICLIYPDDNYWDGQATGYSIIDANTTANTSIDGDGNIVITDSGLAYIKINDWQDSKCAESITVRLQASSAAAWDVVKLFYWGDGISGYEWPGIAVTNTDGWYSYTFASSIKSVNIIWTDGEGDQTVDINDVTASTCYKLNSLSGEKRTVTIVDCSAGELPEDAMTCAEARDAALGGSTNEVTVIGYVTEYVYLWSSSFNSVSFWMADTKDGGKVFEAYRAKCETAAEAPNVGDKVKIVGKLSVYNQATPEISNGTFEILERTSEKTYYTIRFINWDGTELQSLPVEFATTPEYTGVTPLRTDDEYYTYEFRGWTPTISPAIKNFTYKATYKGSPKEVHGQAEETQTTEVTATPTEDGSVVIAWPAVEGATIYTIEIAKNGEIICTLVFNENGQLLAIRFAAPARNKDGRNVVAATQAGKGWTYTVTGMEAGATYTYSVTAKDDSDTKLFEQSVQFTMPASQGIDDINAATKSQKIVRDGKVYILRGEKTYTVTGQEVK